MADSTSALAIKDYSHHQMILPSGWLVLLRLYLPASAQHFHRRRSAASQCPRFRPGNPKNLLKKFKFVLRAYTESQALASCKFLTLEEDQWLDMSLAQPYLVGYFLAKLWERDFKDEGSVITESIVNHNMGLAPALGVKVEALQEQLNALKPTASLNSDGCASFQVIPR